MLNKEPTNGWSLTSVFNNEYPLYMKIPKSKIIIQEFSLIFLIFSVAIEKLLYFF